MNDNFKKQIESIDDLSEIATIISNSTELHESVSLYSNDPFESLYKNGNGKVPMGFKKKGDTIYLIGDYNGTEDDNSSVVEVIVDAVERGLLESAHALGKGGLFIGLVESCSVNRLGFDITSDAELSDKNFLFNGGNQAILVSVSNEKESGFVDYIYNNGIRIILLGHVTKGEFRLDDLSFGFIHDYIG